jgi:hypothetical protein
MALPLEKKEQRFGRCEDYKAEYLTRTVTAQRRNHLTWNGAYLLLQCGFFVFKAKYLALVAEMREGRSIKGGYLSSRKNDFTIGKRAPTLSSLIPTAMGITKGKDASTRYQKLVATRTPLMLHRIQKALTPMNRKRLIRRVYRFVYLSVHCAVVVEFVVKITLRFYGIHL